MIADIAPHPCGGGAKVFPRNCRLRVFFCWKNRWLMGEQLRFLAAEDTASCQLMIDYYRELGHDFTFKL